MWWIVGAALAQQPPEAPPPVEAAPPSCPDRAVPGAEWSVAAVDGPAAQALDAYVFPGTPDNEERAGIRTDGVVVVRHGQVVYERYGRGYTATTPHLAWSVSKTFMNALAGVAVREGRLDVEEVVCAYVDGLPSAACEVSIEDLLSMASGFDWHETYEGDGPTSSSVLAMLYGQGQGDMARFVAGHPLRDPPGTTWMYSSGDTNLLSAAVGAALTPVYGRDFAWSALFEPLGVTSATWERDGAGTLVGSSYLWATPRDLARFGLLWLHDGCWGGERVLPEGWVAWSTEVPPGFRSKPLGRDDGDVQGRQVWLNRPVPEVGQVERPWPSVPEDAYAARGHWKQSITVIPSLDLVVVRVADDRDDTFDFDRFLGLAAAVGAP